ncbi:MAG: beta-ketoacyl synthase N-terminal-like domain-containing protein [Pseudomonadales bacterium]|jgi:3-oxoacyl-[acyl-carrier-protein] synthase-1
MSQPAANSACFLAAGITSSLGTGIAAHLAALQNPPTPPQLLQRTLGNTQESVPYKLLTDVPLADIDTRLLRSIDSAVQQALNDAGLSAREQREMALFVGSSSFDISVSEHHYQQAHSVSDSAIPLGGSPSFGKLASTLRQHYGLHGSEFSFNTACTSSANALWYASRLLATGTIRHALVIGVELINDITALGFHGLGLLTPSVMRPFDAARNGLVLGEAVSALVLGAGDASDFRLWGGANLCDTHSMSAANADGSSVARVIRQALTAAQISPEHIGSVKVHGTASLLNDEAEAAGLLQVFEQMPPVCALKPFLGHTLGACGLSELILMWQALAAKTPFLPATPGIGSDARELGLALNQSCIAPSNSTCLLNYFGFGGNNTALVIGRGQPEARAA